MYVRGPTSCTLTGQENCSVTASSLANLLLRFLNKMEHEVITPDNDLARMKVFMTILIKINESLTSCQKYEI